MYPKGIPVYEGEIESLKQRVADLEDKVNFLLLHEPVHYAPVSAEDKAANEAAVVELLKKGKLVDALKLYREKHLVPFEDAQKAVEELRRKSAA